MEENEFLHLGLIEICERYDELAESDRVKLLVKLARSLKPFPGFLGMETIQAVELDPDPQFPDRGCLVVTDQGEIKELSLDLIPGPTLFGGVDSKETFKDVHLEYEEREVYFRQAITTLSCLMKEKQHLD